MQRRHVLLAAVTGFAVTAAGLGVAAVGWLGGGRAKGGSGAIGGPSNLVDDHGAAVTGPSSRASLP